MSDKKFDLNNFVVDKVLSCVLAYSICPKCGWKQEENKLDSCPVCGQALIIDRWSEVINE